jgi:hypothetical protein
MNKIFIPCLFFLFLSPFAFAQTDTLDTIILSNGEILKGKVLRIKTESIEFVESSTSIIYEYEKKKIDSIAFSNGKILNFSKSTTPPPVQNPTLVEEKGDTIGTQVEIGGGILAAFKSENYDGGFGANIFIELRSASIVAVRADFGLYSADTKVDYLSKGNASFYLIELSLLLRSMSGTLQPYGGVGIGYYSIDNTLDNEVLQWLEQNGYGGKEEIADGIGFNIRGGCDAMFESNFGFFLDLKYWIYNPNVKTTVYPLQNPTQESSAEEEIKLNNISLIIGLLVIL